MIFIKLIFAVLGLFILFSGLNQITFPVSEETQVARMLEINSHQRETKDKSLFFTAYYGGSIQYNPNMPIAPSGGKKIKGFVEYHGIPAVGVNIRLMLNGKYITEYATTNEYGIASWSLADEPWYLNMVEANGWENKPQNDSEYYPVSGMENKLGSKYSSGSTFISEKGKELLGSTHSGVDFKLEINEAIEITWPHNTSVADSYSEIKWNDVYGVDKYLVMIWHHEEKHFNLVVEKVVTDTSLALSDLEFESTKGRNIDYEVEVRGFSGDGYVRAKSTQNSGRGPKFTLSGTSLKENVFESSCKK